MAALTETAAKSIHAATATTVAEAWGLTRAWKNVYITNRDTDPCFVTITLNEENPGDTDTGVTVAVAEADDTILIPAGKTRRVVHSGRRLWVRGSIVGNVSTYDVEGSDFAIVGDFD